MLCFSSPCSDRPSSCMSLNKGAGFCICRGGSGLCAPAHSEETVHRREEDILTLPSFSFLFFPRWTARLHSSLSHRPRISFLFLFFFTHRKRTESGAVRTVPPDLKDHSFLLIFFYIGLSLFKKNFDTVSGFSCFLFNKYNLRHLGKKTSCTYF